MEIFREVRRVLRDDGVCFLNYGDCYASTQNGRAAADIENDDRTFRDKPFNTAQFAKAGSLMMMPHRVAIALAEDGWIIRQDLVWWKRNPMPESVNGWRWQRERARDPEWKEKRYGGKGEDPQSRTERLKMNVASAREAGVDHEVGAVGMGWEYGDDLELKRGSWRHTRAHEYVFMLTKKMGYWSNQEAVREGLQQSSIDRINQETFHKQTGGEKDYKHGTNANRSMRKTLENFAESRAGRNPRSVLDVPTHPYSLGTKSVHWRRAAKDAVSDGMMHIAFPYCREHGKLALRLAKEFYGEREADYLSHIERIYDHLARERSGGSFPTHRHDEHCSEPCNSDWLPPVYSLAAIDHSNASHKMALALETAIPYMPFFEMIGYIDDKRELLSYFAQHLCIYGSRIVSDDLPASLLQRIPHRILDKAQAETLKASDCSCLIYEHYTKIADHYATFPPNLIAPLIRATCPRRACPVCGQGWAAVIEHNNPNKMPVGGKLEAHLEMGTRNDGNMRMGDPINNVLGYRPTCEHDEEAVPGIVFDPFVGSGTTVKVAQDLLRKGIGIDISMEYLDLQAKVRIGQGSPSNQLDDLPLFQ